MPHQTFIASGLHRVILAHRGECSGMSFGGIRGPARKLVIRGQMHPVHESRSAERRSAPDWTKARAAGSNRCQHEDGVYMIVGGALQPLRGIGRAIGIRHAGAPRARIGGRGIRSGGRAGVSVGGIAKCDSASVESNHSKHSARRGTVVRAPEHGKSRRHSSRKQRAAEVVRGFVRRDW